MHASSASHTMYPPRICGLTAAARAATVPLPGTEPCTRTAPKAQPILSTTTRTQDRARPANEGRAPGRELFQARLFASPSCSEGELTSGAVAFAVRS